MLLLLMGAGSDKTAKRMAIHLGKAIRNRREQADLNQDELAWRSDTHRAYMGSIERGDYNITIYKLFQISRALGAKPSEILNDIGF